MKTNELLKEYQYDIERKREENISTLSEFPITKMSIALANSIGYMLGNKQNIDHYLKAIDVGTGSGIHSAVLAINGCSHILGIDIHENAVEAADSRFERIHINKDTGIATTRPIFKKLDVNSFSKTNEKFDVIVTNPPSYFRSATPSIKDTTPLETGLFDGKSEKAGDDQESYLYRFFNNLVKRSLSPEGVVICTWPALQRRLVHDEKGIIIHPVTMLKHWFGWDIEVQSDNPNDFFQIKIPMFYPGLDKTIVKEIKRDIDIGGIYSDLVFAGNKSSNYQPVYPFGVLALIKDKKVQNKFHHVDIDVKIFGVG